MNPEDIEQYHELLLLNANVDHNGDVDSTAAAARQNQNSRIVGLRAWTASNLAWP